MNYALKVLLKEPYRLLKETNGRKFLSLCMRLSNKKRHEKMSVRFYDQEIQLADTWSFLWQFHDIFFRKVYDFKSQSDHPLIIDCGTNIGVSVIRFKKLFPKAEIIGFEPDSEIFQIACNNLKAFENVTLHNKAVWEHSNGVLFSTNEADPGRVDGDKGFRVESIRLKELLDTYQSIDFLKLDIEGGEFVVIEDCAESLRHVKFIFIEIHTFKDQEQKISRIIQILEKAGFRYYIENENVQPKPFLDRWKITSSGMDVQLNMYAINNQ